MRTPSPCCAAWPCTTPTRKSPGSSTGKAAAPPGDCHTPPVESSHCATTGTSHATNPPNSRRRENYSTCPPPPNSSASPRPPCCGGSTTASSPASRSRPARHGESDSPTNCAAWPSTTLPRAGSPSTTPAEHSASPAKRSCRRSSAVSWTPSSPAPDAAKACVSTFPAQPTPYSDHDNQRKEQCDHASKQALMSPSTIHS